VFCQNDHFRWGAGGIKLTPQLRISIHPIKEVIEGIQEWRWMKIHAVRSRDEKHSLQGRARPTNNFTVLALDTIIIVHNSIESQSNAQAIKQKRSSEYASQVQFAPNCKNPFRFLTLYCPWSTIARHLHHRAPDWCWEVQSVQEFGAYSCLSRAAALAGLGLELWG
jgi:hypothetical protein